MFRMVVSGATISGPQFQTLTRSYKGDVTFLHRDPGQAFAVAAVI